MICHRVRLLLESLDLTNNENPGCLLRIPSAEAGMPITVHCKCGKSLTAPDDAEGRHGKCPSCGDRLLITGDVPLLLSEAVVPKIQVKSIVDLGMVKCRFSELKFSFQIDPDGIAFVQIIAIDKLTRGSHYTVLRLDDDMYDQFIQAAKSTEEIVQKYRNSGPSKRMIEIYRQD